MEPGHGRSGPAEEGERGEPSWQAADVEQRVLENARVLWGRSVEQNWHDAVRQICVPHTNSVSPIPPVRCAILSMLYADKL